MSDRRIVSLAVSAVVMVGWLHGFPGKNSTVFEKIGFEKISDYKVEFPKAEDIEGAALEEQRKTVQKRLYEQVPERVKKYSGRMISIRGYMVPMEIKKGMVESFMLVRHPGTCCFGKGIEIADVIYTRPVKPVAYASKVPVEVKGTFEVLQVPDKKIGVILYGITASSTTRLK